MDTIAPSALGLDEILNRLRNSLPELRRCYPLGSVAVFGSRARHGEAR